VVGHMPLEHGTLVRIQASQPKKDTGDQRQAGIRDSYRGIGVRHRAAVKAVASST
jgi:hypothetical protein